MPPNGSEGSAPCAPAELMQAPPEVVQQQQESVTELQNQLGVMEENLADLRGA